MGISSGGMLLFALGVRIDQIGTLARSICSLLRSGCGVAYAIAMEMSVGLMELWREYNVAVSRAVSLELGRVIFSRHPRAQIIRV